MDKKKYPPKRGTAKPGKLSTDARLDLKHSFASIINPLIPKPAGTVAKATLQSAPLAHLEYTGELKLKDKALRLFWQQHHLAGQPEPVIASPRARCYRTTSKRRTILRGATLHLLFGSNRLSSSQKDAFLASPLEPPEHAHIYNFLQKKLSEPAFKILAVHLNYIIIRGSYNEIAVIFNVDTLNGPLVHKLKILAGYLQKLPEKVIGSYIYPDPSCSDYYLESKRPVDLLNFKRLFGKANLSVNYHGCRFNFHPTSFSQVNESIVPIMLNKALELLSPAQGMRLLDLYCGYGLFSHFLASDFKQVVGVDAEGPSIRAAIANSKLNSTARRTKFIAHQITGNLDNVLPALTGPEAIILDPPRQGPQKNVISSLGRRHPYIVLHIFCGIDQIPSALKDWQVNGYQVQRVVPLDMFPGSVNLEVMVLLQPAARS